MFGKTVYAVCFLALRFAASATAALIPPAHIDDTDPAREGFTVGDRLLIPGEAQDGSWQMRLLGAVRYRIDHDPVSQKWMLAVKGRVEPVWESGLKEQPRIDDPESVCYAASTDGIHWTKPRLDLSEFRGTKKTKFVWRRVGSHSGFGFAVRHERRGSLFDSFQVRDLRRSGRASHFPSPMQTTITWAC